MPRVPRGEFIFRQRFRIEETEAIARATFHVAGRVLFRQIAINGSALHLMEKGEFGLGEFEVTQLVAPGENLIALRVALPGGPAAPTAFPGIRARSPAFSRASSFALHAFPPRASVRERWRPRVRDDRSDRPRGHRASDSPRRISAALGARSWVAFPARLGASAGAEEWLEAKVGRALVGSWASGERHARRDRAASRFPPWRSLRSDPARRWTSIERKPVPI